jgi:hypothetical protein
MFARYYANKFLRAIFQLQRSSAKCTEYRCKNWPWKDLSNEKFTAARIRRVNDDIPLMNLKVFQPNAAKRPALMKKNKGPAVRGSDVIIGVRRK